MDLRKLNSILQRHPARVYNGGEKQFISGIEVCTGSLGYGMSIAVGISIGLKMDKKVVLFMLSAVMENIKKVLLGKG